jgi:hypothetical protein
MLQKASKIWISKKKLSPESVNDSVKSETSMAILTEVAKKFFWSRRREKWRSKWGKNC